MSLFASRITGTGSAFPARIVKNAELSLTLDTTDEWIRERTGIIERRISDPANASENNSSLAHQAARHALEMAGKTANDLDAIFFATCTPDTLLPSSSCWLQMKLGAQKAWAIDLNAACSGFVYGLAMADSFIRTGQIKTALVVGSEILSSFVNWEDRTSAILFGDAGGAVIVEQTTSGAPQRILSSHLRSDGSKAELLQILAGGSRMPITPEIQAKKLDKMQMNGREIFKIAVKTLSEFARAAVEANGLKIKDVDWFIPHQANLRIIEAAAKRLEIPMDRVLINIDRYGNTSSATVPTTLDEAVRSGKIQSGHTLLLDVFGAGLTYGSVLLRW